MWYCTANLPGVALTAVQPFFHASLPQQQVSELSLCNKHINSHDCSEVEVALLANLLALESSSQVFRVLVRVSVLSRSSTHS